MEIKNLYIEKKQKTKNKKILPIIGKILLIIATMIGLSFWVWFFHAFFGTQKIMLERAEKNYEIGYQKCGIYDVIVDNNGNCIEPISRKFIKKIN